MQKNFKKYFYGLKQRERVLLAVGLVLLMAVVLQIFVVGPSLKAYNRSRDSLAAKIKLLQKSRAILAEKKPLEAAKTTATPMIKRLESRIVAATTEALGAAALQKQIKELASANHVTITRSASFSPLPLADDVGLLLLPVEIDVKADTLGAFTAFLYELEYGDTLFFFVDDLEIVPLSRGRGVRVNVKAHALTKPTNNKDGG